MPPLVACGRHWEFGSDDLVFPGVVSLFVRTVLFVGVAVGVVYFRDALTCQPAHLLAGFSFAVLGMVLVTIALEWAITFFSARGTIVRTKPRKPVVHLLHFRVFVFVLEVVLLIIGTAFALKTQSDADRVECPNLDDAVLITQIIVAVSWFVLFLFLLSIVIYLDPCHCYSAKMNHSIVKVHRGDGSVDQTIVERHWQVTHSIWEKRFRVACCFAGSDDAHQVAYKEVAEIFAHVFCDVNVVLSDIAAGLVLLQKEHISQEEQHRNNPALLQSCEDTPVNFHNSAERETFKDALHYLKYALGAYSWPLYVYMNPCCGCCRLCCQLQCRPRPRPQVVKDNSCFCYLAGLRRITGLNEVDIIYCTFENSVYQVPFMVCLDHDHQSVVVSVRGTLSFHDIVTDLTATTRPIPLPDFPDFLVHKGMLKTATWILGQLDEGEVLQNAFGKVPNYRLVVVGHSLGSGCACLLAMLLRSRYPDLYCYCYSPSGSLLNEAAAEHSKEFVTSVTLGKDFVARLSVPSSHMLKEDMVRVLETCSKPKFQILFEGGLETLCKCFGRPVIFETKRDDETAEGDEENPDPSPRNQNPEDSLEITPLLQRDLSLIRVQRNRLSSPTENQESDHPLVPLFPPGRVIHIVESGEEHTCFCASRQLEAKWASRDNFRCILVSPDMIRDHFPDVLLNAMNFVWKQKSEELENLTLPLPGSGVAV